VAIDSLSEKQQLGALKSTMLCSCATGKIS
jgi:hypothetical protein